MQAPDRETDGSSHEHETAQYDKHLTWAAGARQLQGLLKPSLAHNGQKHLPTETYQQHVE